MRVGLLVVAIITIALGASLTGAYIPHVPTDKEPYIVLPSYALPTVARPGGEIKVYVRGPEERPAEAMIVGLRNSYRLQVVSVGTEKISVDPTYEMSVRTIVLSLPREVEPGLYTLLLSYARGLTFMPNSVIVDPQGGPKGSIRIAQLTDLHIGAEEGGMGNNFKNTRNVALLNTLVERFGVQLIVYTGDLVDVGSDLMSYRELFSSLSQVLAPQLAITGNHDWSQVDSTRMLAEMYYGRYVVPLRVWNFSYGDFMFVGIDTRMEGFPDAWQLDWLERTVAGTRRAVVILMHHPFFTREGEYVGSAEALRSQIYSSWRNAFDIAKRFLEIVDNNKHIVAVLAGHVHRNADAIYYRSDGSRVFFITTATANHGYPAGYFWSVKIIDIKANGEVSVIIPSGRRYTPTTGAIDTTSFRVFEVKDRRSTAVSWMWNVSGFTDMSVDAVILPFYLNSTIPLDAYKIYDPFGAVKKIERYNLITHYLIKVEADLRRAGKITIASYEDKEKPELTLLSPLSPALNMPMSIEIQVVERGWGIERVFARVFINDKEVSLLNAIRSNNPEQFRFVFVPREEGKYRIVIEAIDLAGNSNSKELSFSLGTVAPQPTPTSTITATPTATAAEPTATAATTTTVGTTQTKQENTATTGQGEAREQAGNNYMPLALAAAIIALLIFLTLMRRR